MNDVSKSIGWCEKTWNPVTGCLNGCSYCYARKMYHRFGKSFEPTFFPKRLEEPLKLKKPARIFCGSVTDLFGDGVKNEWLCDILDVIRRTPQHTYFILTKKPLRTCSINSSDIPPNLYLGASLIGNGIPYFDNLSFLSLEPLLEKVDIISVYYKWVIIGGLSPCLVHRKEWVEKIIRIARENKQKVFVKDNAVWHNDIKELL